jgi:hypothetical protein
VWTARKIRIFLRDLLRVCFIGADSHLVRAIETAHNIRLSGGCVLASGLIKLVGSKRQTDTNVP